MQDWTAKVVNKKDENDSARSKTCFRSEEDIVDAKLEAHVPCTSH